MLACEWQPMETAPRDRPILAWCDHASDSYVEDVLSGRLTPYAAHAEGLGHAVDGYQVVEWGGGYHDPDGEMMPDWWFVAGSGFECPASPIRWTNLPLPPTD